MHVLSLSFTHIGKLNGGKLPQIGQTVVSSVFIYDEGDVLHVFGAEPPRHDCFCCGCFRCGFNRCRLVPLWIFVKINMKRRRGDFEARANVRA